MNINIEILEEFSGSNDQMIVKGKRTKRLRPSSSTSSSGGGAGDGGRGGGDFNSNSLASSPMSTSSGISTSTEEDEDMANCLILLARGGLSDGEIKIKPPVSKFSSRKLAEMATTNGKVGIYLYECKTCSRTFPSFQALGGHRASHKKPKTTMDVDQKKSPSPPDEEERKFTKLNTISPPISTQLPKIHECSICGSEFNSGQALGGHMRRHRSTINGTTNRSGDGCTSTIDDSEKTRNMLELDLNLPAPLEDDRHETEFDQYSSNQQPPLVFSAAALVDCHY